MRAVVLAGGLGTRLRPYTTVIPKPLIPIGDRPVLEHILRGMYAEGLRHADLSVSYLGELIELCLEKARLPADLDLRFCWESEPLGTAGALRGVPDLGGTFIVMNGDILTNLSYRELVDYHHEREAAITIAMRTQHVDIDLGVLHCDDGFVTGYDEKPRLSYSVSMGVYVYDERALAYLPPGPCSFPDLVLRLLAAGERVAAFPSDADWYDLGTVEELERASQLVESDPGRFRFDERSATGILDPEPA